MKDAMLYLPLCGPEINVAAVHIARLMAQAAMLEPQECGDCAFYLGWTEAHGEQTATCNHRERFDKFWGENPGEDFAVNECSLFADREVVRAAVNGVIL